jgi:hypothetical protein
MIPGWINNDQGTQSYCWQMETKEELKGEYRTNDHQLC